MSGFPFQVPGSQLITPSLIGASRITACPPRGARGGFFAAVEEVLDLGRRHVGESVFRAGYASFPKSKM